jgi:hypothetical protein
MTNRMSILDTSLYCPQAGRLSAQYGAGVDAAAGRCYHARCAGDPRWRDILTRLPEDQQARVATLVPVPHTLTVPAPKGCPIWSPGVPLELPPEKAKYEQEVSMAVGLGLDGSDELVGHPDRYWISATSPLGSVAFVLDLKMSHWTCPNGTNSLQLQAYGFAVAFAHGCQWFVPIIWSATEGALDVGKAVDTASVEGEETLRRIESAALNTEGDAVAGAHCQHCYARLHCPEYLAPASCAETALGPAVTMTIQDNAAALDCLRSYEALCDLAELAEKNLRIYAERTGGIVDIQSGQTWGPGAVAGRVSFDRAAAESAGLDLSPYMKQGKPSQQYRWRKTRIL